VPVTEVADQDVVAEDTEVRRSDRDSPRRIKISAGRDATDEVAGNIE